MFECFVALEQGVGSLDRGAQAGMRYPRVSPSGLGQPLTGTLTPIPAPVGQVGRPLTVALYRAGGMWSLAAVMSWV